jgi:hypothetical protein
MKPSLAERLGQAYQKSHGYLDDDAMKSVADEAKKAFEACVLDWMRHKESIDGLFERIKAL